MVDKKTKMDFLKQLSESQAICINSSEQFFFILGQFIIYLFYCLGGVDQYKNEINYLTNPYLPKSIFELGQRNIKFISHFPKLLKSPSKPINKVYNALMDSYSVYNNPTINESSCSSAFYEGLYGNNLLIKYFHNKL